jgi:hypothetical protein
MIAQFLTRKISNRSTDQINIIVPATIGKISAKTVVSITALNQRGDRATLIGAIVIYHY